MEGLHECAYGHILQLPVAFLHCSPAACFSLKLSCMPAGAGALRLPSSWCMHAGADGGRARARAAHCHAAQSGEAEEQSMVLVHCRYPQQHTHMHTKLLLAASFASSACFRPCP